MAKQMNIYRLGVNWSSRVCHSKSQPVILALGSFDGIHRGHSHLLQCVRERASHNASSGILTLYPHPRSVLPQEKTTLNPVLKICDLHTQLEVLRSFSLDFLAMAHFTREFSRLSAQEFVKQVLIETLGCSTLVVGQDACFGADREGDVPWMRNHLSSFGIDLLETPLVKSEGGGKISSRDIRESLSRGDVFRAAELLGRPFSRSGRVVPGKQMGTTIGVPTLNVPLRSRELAPRYGVYIGTCHILGSDLPAIANVGMRPTVGGDPKRPLLEIHVLQIPDAHFSWDSCAPRERVRFSFLRFIRDEKKFSSIEELKQQILLDIESATQFHGLQL